MDKSGLITIYEDKIKKFLPEKISICTSNGNFDLKKDVITREIDILRVCYSQNTPEKNDGDVLVDGEPDTLEFDIHFVKDNNKLKILVDITYGDQMVSEFTLNQPDRISITHYTGIGSKADPDTHFGLSDESILSFIKFINAFGFSFDPKDFTFIDKYPDTYIQEDIKIMPLSGDQKILVVNNSKPQENRYLKNITKYLRMRGIEYIIANNDRDVERIVKQENIIGSILSGSDYRITKKLSKSEGLVSVKALEILRCPIIGICYGFQAMSQYHGSSIKSSDKLIQNNIKLTEYDSTSILFKDINVDITPFSFSFNDIIKDCPKGFRVIAKVNNIIAGIYNDELKRYGLLFHPEDVERTFKVLDNFISTLHDGQKEQEYLKLGKFKYLESFSDFLKIR